MSAKTWILIFSTIAGICCSSWIVIWASMEINTLAMCYILSTENKVSFKPQSPALKYFIVQVLASIVILTAASHPGWHYLALLALAAKVGAWPAHGWFMSMVPLMGLDKPSVVLLLTWQKILPITLMAMLNENMGMNMTILAMMTMAAAVPVASMLTSLEMKGIVAAASINSNSWLIMSSAMSMSTMYTFLAAYLVTLFFALNLFEESSKTKSPYNPTMTLLVVSNFVGMPPFTMFWAKVMIVKKAIACGTFYFPLLVLLMAACLLVFLVLEMMAIYLMQKGGKEEAKKNKPKVRWVVSIVVTSMAMALYVL